MHDLHSSILTYCMSIHVHVHVWSDGAQISAEHTRQDTWDVHAVARRPLHCQARGRGRAFSEARRRCQSQAAVAREQAHELVWYSKSGDVDSVFKVLRQARQNTLILYTYIVKHCSGYPSMYAPLCLPLHICSICIITIFMFGCMWLYVFIHTRRVCVLLQRKRLSQVTCSGKESTSPICLRNRPITALVGV